MKRDENGIIIEMSACLQDESIEKLAGFLNRLAFHETPAAPAHGPMLP
jgi:hypothetical protein